MPVLLNGGKAAEPETTRRECHSLMPVLLNGGAPGRTCDGGNIVPHADACVTEWRNKSSAFYPPKNGATR